MCAAVPEGIKVKLFVQDLKDAYESLPKKAYGCEMTRTNKGVCYTPGKNVELAFESLLKELRTYSVRALPPSPPPPMCPPDGCADTPVLACGWPEQKIQLGDYRKVEFNAF